MPRPPRYGKCRLRHNVPMTDIVLATLNARYAHASLGLRYLRALRSAAGSP